MKVQEIMKTEFPRGTVPGTRDTVLQLMADSKTNAVPLLKKDTEELAGMVTRLDLMRQPQEDQLALLMDRNPPVCSLKDNIEDIVRTILKQGVRRLPVVDEKRHLKGLITVHQLIRKVISTVYADEPITPFIEHRIACIWDNTPLRTAYTIMRLAGTDVLPALSDKGELVGVISVSDIINQSQIVRERRSTSVTAASEGTDWSWDATAILYIATNELQLPDKPVSEFMVRSVVTTFEQATIGETVKLMRKHDVDQLPVTKAHGELSGIIRDVDLLRVLVKD